jgi:hypothetical protein
VEKSAEGRGEHRGIFTTEAQPIHPEGTPLGPGASRVSSKEGPRENRTSFLARAIFALKY